VNFDEVSHFLMKLVDRAGAFYGTLWELPGYVQLSVGLLDVRLYRLYRHARSGETGWQKGSRFPDESFRADFTTHVAGFLKAPRDAAAPLLDQLAYGFDLPPLPIQQRSR
jgi:hypothetical protein